MVTPSRKLFVNLAVGDVQKSIDFFTTLGFAFNKQFTDEKAACMVVSDEAFVMLLGTAFFKTFTRREIADTSPVCDYGRSKLEAERVCRRYRSFGLDVVVLRPRVLIGPGRLGIYQMVFNWVADAKPIYILGSGDRPFQALSVNDLISAVRSTLEAPCENEDFNLGAAEYGSVRSDLEALLHHAGNGRRIVTLPAGAAKATLWMLDVLDLSPLTAWHYLTCDAAFYFDCSKAARLLGWRPSVNNAEMLCEAYDWYIAHRSSVDRDFGAVHTKSLEQRALRVLKVLS